MSHCLHVNDTVGSGYSKITCFLINLFYNELLVTTCDLDIQGQY